MTSIFCNDFNRTSPKVFVNELCQFDVISFDVFDTLLLRPFSSPRVLFSIMEHRLGVYKFSKIRVDSEDETRADNLKKYGHDTTTLDEIYSLVSKKTSLNPSSTAALEFSLELKYSSPNPYFIEVFSLLKKFHKQLIVCSDMYLSKDQIKKLLNNNGFNGFEKIFVSSEQKKSKKKGDLFDLIKKTYPQKKVIHIGDNYLTDVTNSEQVGIKAYYYKNVNDVGGKNIHQDMSYITGRVYSAIINNHFFSSNKKHDDAYKLGYMYGGIYILGFVQWINRFVNERAIEKVLFLSRDGDIFSKIYNELPNKKPWIYFYWSRLAGAKITAYENFYEFCQRMIWHKARGVYSIKIKHILNFFGLTSLNNSLAQYDLSQNDVLSNNNALNLEALFYAHKSYILSSFQSDIDVTIESIKKAVGNSKKIAIVDVGWAGTGPLIIKKVIQNYLKLDCDVYNLLAGYRQPIENMDSLYTMDSSIYSYLFSSLSNKDLYKIHLTTGSGKNNLLLELFSQSCSPSFIGYTKQGLRFDMEDKENYQIINNIHLGVLSFVKEYLKNFDDDSFILNISPYDAYVPFRELISNPNIIDSILEKLIISRGIFYDVEEQSKETWKTFLNK